MNGQQKIERLCQFLKIQDELVIIRVKDTCKNENYYVYDKPNGGVITMAEVPFGERAIWLSSFKQPYRLIQKRNEAGEFEIPDPEEWKEETKMDY